MQRIEVRLPFTHVAQTSCRAYAIENSVDVRVAADSLNFLIIAMICTLWLLGA